MATTKSSAVAPVPERQYVRKVVLDWNIVHYWISKKMSNAINPVLVDMNNADLQFIISEISVYEAQCRISVGKHTEALQFLDGLPRYPIDTNTHKIAGIIMSCYKDHKQTKSHAKEISLQDGFNAACAILNDSLLVTADYNDYPRPFFKEVYQWTITNESGHSQKIYLLEPDIPAFDSHANRWLKAEAASQ